MSVTRHTLYNLAGAAVPLVVSLITVPLYLHQIGEARYGVLAIVWLLLGYFGLFDMGLSRATANHIARLCDAPIEEREMVFWTALTINAILGVSGGLVLFWIGAPLLAHLLRISGGLRFEVLAALPFMAAAIPVSTITAVLTGTLEARERFGILNAIQAAGTVLFQGAPLAAAYLVGPHLQVLVPVAIGVRILSVVPIFIAVVSALPLRHRPRFRAEWARRLFGYGAWVTVTNVIGPILSSIDRFVIAAVSGAAAVAYYTVPFNLASRAGILPLALSRALFPRLSTVDQPEATRLVIESVSTLSSAMTPLVVLGIFIMHPFLALWIGPVFAGRAAPVGEIILLGIWINSLAFVPLASLQAQGRPDIVAKFHALELTPYAIVLWAGLHLFGLPGAAMAWAARVGVDALFLFWASGTGRSVTRGVWPDAVFVFGAWLSIHFSPISAIFRMAISFVLLVISIIWSLYSSAWLRGRAITAARRLISKRGHARER
jgi:O-antigen/teichoic acid export membrane protein